MKPKPTRYQGIYMLDANTYRIRARVLDPRTGKLKEVDRTRECTLKEAVALQAEWRESAIEDEGHDRRVKLKDYARSWLRSRLPNLKPSTRAKYAHCLDVYIVPELGDFYLDALTPMDVRKWVASKSEKYAGWTVNGALRVLRTMVRDAMVDLRLTHDPCARVLAPKVRVFTDEDPNLLGADELAMLLESVRTNEPYWYALAVTLAFTGLRWGEATALKWTDVDAAKGVIWVRRGNWQGQEVTTKTERIRSVPLTPQLADVLAAHRAWQESLPADTRRGEGRLILTGVQAGWIFPARTGGLHKGFNFGVILRRCLKSAGIERHVTVHGLRRTFNNLLRQVTSGEVVRSITGHSTVAMTEHYSHIGAGEKLAAAGRMIQLMQPPVSGGSSGGSPENKNADSL